MVPMGKQRCSIKIREKKRGMSTFYSSLTSRESQGESGVEMKGQYYEKGTESLRGGHSFGALHVEECNGVEV